ncbi:hypothetical protein [Deinococcus arcticus]|uniref:hypothetical protein n=1 Tax=Deinococcus arcticus TaxID=2136176 RepID=UPI001E4491BA|nr:hypothetical protein [Deinococcus arcticus]
MRLSCLCGLRFMVLCGGVYSALQGQTFPRWHQAQHRPGDRGADRMLSQAGQVLAVGVVPALGAACVTSETLRQVMRHLTLKGGELGVLTVIQTLPFDLLCPRPHDRNPRLRALRLRGRRRRQGWLT